MQRQLRRLVPVAGLLLLALALAVPAAAASQRNFRAHLAGREEVPPVDTRAQGQAILQFSQDGSELSYKLIVANIENVVAAHIHCGAVGVNGPIGVTLFLGPPAGGRFDGVLAQGMTTAPDPGNACSWGDLDDVLSAILSGDTYVNVHTNPGVPSGAIRGQIH